MQKSVRRRNWAKFNTQDMRVQEWSSSGVAANYTSAGFSGGAE